MSDLNREKLSTTINNILAKKNFSRKVKNYLYATIMHIYSRYNPPSYVKTSLREYVLKYLIMLENLEGCEIYSLEDLKKKDSIAKEFRSDIVNKKGEKVVFIEREDGFYPESSEPYNCRCLGFTDHSSSSIYALDSEPEVVVSTLHHEGTHLNQGAYAGYISSLVPLSSEFTSMLIEGHAVTNEMYLQDNEDVNQMDIIEDDSSIITISSTYCYPLFTAIYNLLEIILGSSFLAEAMDSSEKVSFLTLLSAHYKDINASELYAHIIYLLKCQNKKYSSKTIERALSFYRLKMNAEKTKILEKIGYYKLSLAGTAAAFSDLSKFLPKNNIIDRYNWQLNLTRLENELHTIENDSLERMIQNVCLESPNLEKSWTYLITLAEERLKQNPDSLECLDYQSLLEDIQSRVEIKSLISELKK